MNKNLKKSMAFVITALLVVILINLAWNSKIISQHAIVQNEISLQDYLSENHDRVVEHGFFGDSHVYHGIDAQHFKKGFNFGIVGENYVKTYFKLRDLLDRNISFENIYLQFDLHTFSPSNVKNGVLMSNLWHYHKITSYSEIRSLTNMSYSDYFIKSYMPMIGRGSYLIRLLRPEGDSFRSADLSKRDMDFIASSNIKEQFEMGTDVSKLSVVYLIKTIELAEEHDIEVHLIMYPVSEAYYEAAVDIGLEHSTFLKGIHGAVEKNTGPVSLMDYHELYYDHPEYFYDSNHLNIRGADLFSEYLANNFQE